MNKKNKEITFVEAINDALNTAMSIDDNVICLGLGATDPRGIFGTTLGLKEKYGSDRVIDPPTSENANTGIAIGAAMDGIRPVVIHQRTDFSLLTLDQIINNAAKWHYMFNGANTVPITNRLIVGRGWGQGPTHSQNLQALFSHIPGLKVIMPSTTYDAKGLLLSSIFDNDPVIFIEHRWLYNQIGVVPEGDYRIPIGKANVINKGNDITIVSMSYMTIETMRIIELLSEHNISCELIDLRSIKPIDSKAIISSVNKTGNLLVLDTANRFASVSSEIITFVVEECFSKLKQSPRRITLPDFPVPTSPGLTENFYPKSNEIIKEISVMLSKKINLPEKFDDFKHDVPGNWFKGPF